MQDSIFTMPTLPTELIIEILLRVSVKSLLKFRCVSKSWLALIRSPQFVKAHLSVSAKNKDYTHHRFVLTEVRNLFTNDLDVQYILKDCSVSSLRNDSVIEALDLNYPMKNPQLNVCVVGSVNGLICLDIEKNGLVLWNPSLRLYRKLPDSRLKVSGGSHIDRATSVKYGFGYDESSDDYKVVGVLCMERRYIFHHHEVKIYSLKSDSWRSMEYILDGVQLITPCKFLNGKLHWAGELNVGFHKDRNIISIDLADEKCGKLEQPLYVEGKIFVKLEVPLGVEGKFFVKLEVLGSDLSVFCNYNESHADVWVMREYGVKESWTKTYTIKYPTYHWSPFISQRLCMSNKGDILLVPGSTLMVHNPEDEPIRYPKVTKFGCCTVVNIYIESLVCAPLFGSNKA